MLQEALFLVRAHRIFYLLKKLGSCFGKVSAPIWERLFRSASSLKLQAVWGMG